MYPRLDDESRSPSPDVEALYTRRMGASDIQKAGITNSHDVVPMIRQMKEEEGVVLQPTTKLFRRNRDTSNQQPSSFSHHGQDQSNVPNDPYQSPNGNQQPRNSEEYHQNQLAVHHSYHSEQFTGSQQPTSSDYYQRNQFDANHPYHSEQFTDNQQPTTPEHSYNNQLAANHSYHSGAHHPTSDADYDLENNYDDERPMSGGDDYSEEYDRTYSSYSPKYGGNTSEESRSSSPRLRSPAAQQNVKSKRPLATPSYEDDHHQSGSHSSNFGSNGGYHPEFSQHPPQHVDGRAPPETQTYRNVMPQPDPEVPISSSAQDSDDRDIIEIPIEPREKERGAEEDQQHAPAQQEEEEEGEIDLEKMKEKLEKLQQTTLRRDLETAKRNEEISRMKEELSRREADLVRKQLEELEEAERRSKEEKTVQAEAEKKKSIEDAKKLQLQNYYIREAEEARQEEARKLQKAKEQEEEEKRQKEEEINTNERKRRIDTDEAGCSGIGPPVRMWKN